MDTPEKPKENTAGILVNSAQAFMALNYGGAKTQSPDWYHARLGFLIDFITDVYGAVIDDPNES